MQESKDIDKLFCDKCDDFVEYNIESIQESRNILNQEEIEINAKVAVCKNCKEKLFNEKLDMENQKRAFDKFREKKNILSVKEISRLLGWGEITYHRYEKGSLPDQTHNNQLRLIKEPSNVKILLENNSDNLSSKTNEKLNKRLEEMIANKNKVEVTLPAELYKKIKMKAEKDKMRISEYLLFLITKEYAAEKAEKDKSKLKKEIQSSILRYKTSPAAVWNQKSISEEKVKYKIKNKKSKNKSI
ncbi:MAG: XRE family transcriptional regulator [Halanaerobium sp.]|nr:MAG: XRE family transcriptional regulator [Halanaerobium sp.]